MVNRLYYPVMRYVGGEDMEVLEREVRDTDASAIQLRKLLTHECESTAYHRYFARSVTFGPGEAEREFQDMERLARKAERRLWLLIRRKGDN